MLNPLRNFASNSPIRLLSNGGSSLGVQLAKRCDAPNVALRAAFKVDSVVKVYDTHVQAEAAIRKLQEAGVDMRTLSIAAKEARVVEHVSGFYTAGDRMLHWGAVGAFWGAVWGLLLDSAFFAIPGIGPVVLAGPLVSWIVAILEGAVVFGGVSALGAGLVNIGIPKHSVIEYETALKTNKYLLIVHGTTSDVGKARGIIGDTSHGEYAVHGENVFAQ
jgi:uncharacterized membrane protein